MPVLRQHGEPPACPFCGAALPRPRRRPWNTTSVLPGARCACGGDRRRSDYLVPGRDYQELIENYDPQLHRYVKGFRGYRRGMARLYLVKLTGAADPSATAGGGAKPV